MIRLCSESGSFGKRDRLGHFSTSIDSRAAGSAGNSAMALSITSKEVRDCGRVENNFGARQARKIQDLREDGSAGSTATAGQSRRVNSDKPSGNSGKSTRAGQAKRSSDRKAADHSGKDRT